MLLKSLKPFPIILRCLLATVSLLSTFLKLLHEWEDKEKRKTVIISVIGQGGLRMMDFEIMNKALKIAWIKRITEHVLPVWKI